MSQAQTFDPISLVSLIKKGDSNAFSKLYDAYSPALFGTVCKIIKDDSLSEDVIQDVFVKIWKNIQNFDSSKGSIYTWMLNIARNTAIDHYRKIKKTGEREIQNEELFVSNENKSGTQQQINHIGLKSIVRSLSKEHQEMIDYIYYNGYTQQEVADELNMPLGSVKTKVRSALIELRKVFKLIIFWI